MAGLGGTVLRRPVLDVEAEIAAAETAQRNAKLAVRRELPRARRERDKEARWSRTSRPSCAPTSRRRPRTRDVRLSWPDRAATAQRPIRRMTTLMSAGGSHRVAGEVLAAKVHELGMAVPDRKSVKVGPWLRLQAA